MRFTITRGRNLSTMGKTGTCYSVVPYCVQYSINVAQEVQCVIYIHVGNERESEGAEAHLHL